MDAKQLRAALRDCKREHACLMANRCARLLGA